MALRHVHLFECRRSTFEDVLQESLITLTHRLGVAVASTTITTSVGKDIPEMLEPLTLPTATVLDDSTGDMVLRVPANGGRYGILEAVEAWPDRFAELGLCISTGPVVLFRTGEFLLATLDGEESAPLLEPHNVKAVRDHLAGGKTGEADGIPGLPGISQASGADAEFRSASAVQCQGGATSPDGQLVPAGGRDWPYLAMENHLNYVYHADRELTEERFTA